MPDLSRLFARPARVISDARPPVSEYDADIAWQQECAAFGEKHPRPGAHVVCRWCGTLRREFTILYRKDGKGLEWHCVQCKRPHLSELEWSQTAQAREASRQEVEIADMRRRISSRRSELESLTPRVDALLRSMRSGDEDAMTDAVLADADLCRMIVRAQVLRIIVHG